MRIERELMRGAGPVAVLKLLESGAKYGYELVEQLTAETNGVLEVGQSTLYPLLYNLESQGLIKPQWQQADSGRQRKYYSLIGKGKKRLSRDSKQWQAVSEAMLRLGVISDPHIEPALEGGA